MLASTPGLSTDGRREREVVEFNAALVGCICDGDLRDALALQPEAEVVGHKLSGGDFRHGFGSVEAFVFGIIGGLI